MKIVLVTEATSSGVGRHFMDIATFFSEQEDRIYIVHSLNRADSIYKNRLADIETKITHATSISMQRAISPIEDFVSLLQIYKYFSTIDELDVVHVHSSKSGFIGSLAARLNRAKCIIFTPNAFASMGSTGLKKRLLLLLERMCGDLCDYLVAVSIDESNYALENGIVHPQKIRLIRNGVDIPSLLSFEEQRQTFRAKIGIAPTTRLIGSIGRIAFQKDPLLFVELAHLRSKKYTSTEEKYIMIGDGDLAPYVKAKIKELNLEDYILFMGFQKDVSSILPGLDIYVLHSKYEGMPYTVLEAMSYGLPVISTKVPGIQELISNKELIVEPGDVHALDKALDVVASPSERKEMGRLNREIIAHDFTRKIMCNRLFELYKTGIKDTSNSF
jgi:glycosyltransferase involved in cell wall biosynthesis